MSCYCSSILDGQVVNDLLVTNSPISAQPNEPNWFPTVFLVQIASVRRKNELVKARITASFDNLSSNTNTIYSEPVTSNVVLHTVTYGSGKLPRLVLQYEVLR